MKRVLITGGAGFIGSHVARALLAEGNQVTVFDSLVSGSREAVPEEALFIQGDIRNRDELAHAFSDIDAVVHLAALVSVPESIAHPEETHDVNVAGTENVFTQASVTGCSRVVYATSAAVYGDEQTLPKREDSPLVPQSPYAESKVADEQIAMRFAENGLSALGLRFFNVYGPGQRADHAYASVIPRFVAKAKAGEALPLTGDGFQTRDFIHVSDIAEAVRKALNSDALGVCNIASGKETKLLDLIAMIRAVYPVEVDTLPPRPGDILRSVADISRAREVLDWQPRTALEQGVTELLK
jgi:UDP-glucose 4-epimerase